MSELFDKSIRTLELPRVLQLLSEQAVSPHLPPVERMPVPVTPFPKLFRDDPEPA